MIKLCWLALLFGIICLTTACSAEIGDTCGTNVECASMPGAICDISIPEGYCTFSNCRPNGCPDNAVCVDFDDVSSYCMRYCEDNDECRDGHVCRKDRGSKGFCYLPAK